MAKFCTSCGSSVNEAANNCPNCGAPIKAPAPQAAPAQAASVQATESAQAAPAQNKANPNISRYIGMGAVAVLAIIIIALIANLFGGSYKTPLKDFFNGIEKEKYKTLQSAFSDKLLDKMNIDRGDMKDLTEEIYDTIEDLYGEDFKISYKIEDKEKADSDEVDILNATMKLAYGKKITIKKAYSLDVEVTIKGDDDKETFTMSFVVADIKGDGWCIMDSPSSYTSSYYWY